MPIVPNSKALKLRLDRYFWSNGSGEMQALTDFLRSNFSEFNRVAVIGGLVRDFARGGRDCFRSDVDLVIDDSPEDVEFLANRLGAKKNRFGGFGCVSPEGWKVDFWALDETWGGRYVPIRELEDVVSCTFFDWDSAAYELWSRKLICGDDYIDRIRSRELEVNLLPNPAVKGNLIRAIRRLVLWNASAGPRLGGFIDEYLNSESFEEVKQEEARIFPNPVCIRWGAVSEAKRDLLDVPLRRSFKQLDLFAGK